LEDFYKDTLNHNPNRILFSVLPGHLYTIDEILKAVKEIFKNGKDYYSSSCRDFVLKNFNKDTCIDDTIKLYKELLTKKD
ncbi:MAG: hypothetical protein RR229_00005, partial [Oscillospiraceae bacterium]